MEWYDYLLITAAVLICIWGTIQAKRKGATPRSNIKPRHYSDFDKRLENY